MRGYIIFYIASIYVISYLRHPSAGSAGYSVQAITTFKSSKNVKRILLWTDFYQNKPNIEVYCASDNVLANCPYSNCEFTTDKGLLNSSDAIVFHGRNLRGNRTIGLYSDKYIDLPPYRASEQLWVFLMIEAPVHTWIDLAPFDKNVFNMTMTYRPDSDIYVPYGRLLPLEGTDSQHQQFLNVENGKKTKRQLVAWAVSNCKYQPSGRRQVVDELRQYIPVDIYGKCGTRKCVAPLSSTNFCDLGLICHKYLGSKYKFYLAFENSLCEDYITEKFYDALYVGIVPIVYGYGDYSRVAPKGSYIDAREFSTMKSLADYLLHLDKTPSEYEKYFEWRKYFRVEVSFLKQAWCALCAKLWTTETDRVYQVHNLSDWWFHKKSQNVSRAKGLNENACSDPNELQFKYSKVGSKRSASESIYVSTSSARRNAGVWIV